MSAIKLCGVKYKMMNELGPVTFRIAFIISLLRSNRLGFKMYVSCEAGIEYLNVTHTKYVLQRVVLICGWGKEQ